MLDRSGWGMPDSRDPHTINSLFPVFSLRLGDARFQGSMYY